MVKYTDEQILELILRSILAKDLHFGSVVRNRKGHYKSCLIQIQQEGYSARAVDGEIRETPRPRVTATRTSIEI